MVDLSSFRTTEAWGAFQGAKIENAWGSSVYESQQGEHGTCMNNYRMCVSGGSGCMGTCMHAWEDMMFCMHAWRLSNAARCIADGCMHQVRTK